jgi:hypothetical protein
MENRIKECQLDLYADPGCDDASQPAPPLVRFDGLRAMESSCPAAGTCGCAAVRLIAAATARGSPA